MKAKDIYPITAVTYPGGSTGETYISYDHMEDYTAPVEFRAFLKYIEGQACPVDGFYIPDVDEWLSNKTLKEQTSEKV